MSNRLNQQRRRFIGATMAAATTQLGMLRYVHAAATAGQLAVEGEFPSLGGASAWLNAQPLTPDALRGKVVLVNFCTYSCVNWLRTLPYVRAWAAKYRDQGLVVIGVHTPEFGFEKDLGNIRRALNEMRVSYPVAVDSEYKVWRAFNNDYWPALYFIDAQGRIRHHKFGEGDYEQSERVIQRLLADAGASGVDRRLVSVDARGVETQADLRNLKSPETYVGYARMENFASPGGPLQDLPRVYTTASPLDLNQWALAGNWTIGTQATIANKPDGRIACCFHARDVNLVLGPPAAGKPVPFRVAIDGRSPGADQGLDVDQKGNGVVTVPRLYQLVRQRSPIRDRQFAIEFLGSGVEAFVFTFG
jgi:thiol-disulfide isomerase/thioredoxin